MRLGRFVTLISLLAVAGYGADVCNPADLLGPYAFQLAGTTTIAGTTKPTASLGRVVFDGAGNLSGTATAMFRGLLLGNPVTGTYEAKTDCTLTWKLQDDSGAFQHFSGNVSSDATRVQFKQTDPGGAQRGIMQRTADTCTAADVRSKYDFTLLGGATPMQEGGASGSVTVGGTIDVDQNGSLRLTTPQGGSTTGTFQVENDCTIHLNLLLPAPGGETAAPAELRGALVNGGREILAIQTDPGAMVAAHFSSK